jgi:2-(1,2-epoxy-1,2-dihydrophenyl)acetyl-CoA isomerase
MADVKDATDVTAGEAAVGYAVENGVAWIRLNRPASLNAIDAALRLGLFEAVKRAERDEAAKVVVVTGEGRGFCAGADLRELPSREGSVEEVRAGYELVLGRLHTMPKPTIAAVNGVAAGIGASLAMACDLRYAVPHATFVEAFVRIGLTVDGGATWFLPRLIGVGRALELFYTGDPLGAEEAARLGLVNRVLPVEELETFVRGLAERLAAGPTGALGAIKRSVNYAAQSTLEEALEFEFHLQGVQMGKEDFREGVSAFLEKRQPRFQGR